MEPKAPAKITKTRILWVLVLLVTPLLLGLTRVDYLQMMAGFGSPVTGVAAAVILAPALGGTAKRTFVKVFLLSLMMVPASMFLAFVGCASGAFSIGH